MRKHGVLIVLCILLCRTFSFAQLDKRVDLDFSPPLETFIQGNSGAVDYIAKVKQGNDSIYQAVIFSRWIENGEQIRFRMHLVTYNDQLKFVKKRRKSSVRWPSLKKAKFLYTMEF